MSMTVQDLIDYLMEIKDKKKLIEVFDFNGDITLLFESDLFELKETVRILG